MRISEFKGEKALDLLAEIIEPAAAIFADEKVTNAFKKDTDENKKGIPALAAHIFKNHKADVGVAIVDSDSLPALLLAPEEGWAVVNVAALSKANPPADVLASRVRKELLRGFALAGGCALIHQPLP